MKAKVLHTMLFIPQTLLLLLQKAFTKQNHRACKDHNKVFISLVCKSFSRQKTSIQDSFVSQLIPQTMLWVTNKTLAK